LARWWPDEKPLRSRLENVAEGRPGSNRFRRIGFIRKEESMFHEEFGDEYAAYQKRTRLLLPFVY
jgi:hypothetical protein